MKKLDKITAEWNECSKLKVFEIHVIDKRTNEHGYIIFDISINKTKFIAEHEGLTEKECRSKKIAFESIKIDPDFSLDENLQCLYDVCICAIVTSEFFELSE
jgi:hypothetical protein